MSLNTIELKDFLISDLYRTNLVDSPGFRRPVVAQPSTAPEESDTAQTSAGNPAISQQPAVSSAPSQQSGISSAPWQQPGISSSPSTQLPAAAQQPSAASQQSPASQQSSTASQPSAVGSNTSTHPSPASQQAPAASQQSAVSSTLSQPSSPATQPPVSEYKSLGNNRRKISIVVSSPGIAFLPDDQLAFLGKMLEACRMNMGDIAIVNHSAQPVRIANLKSQLQPECMILFGTGPVDIGLPMDFPMFKLQQYDQCVYLTAPSLGAMLVPGEESKMLKSKLWVSLKTMFGI